MGHFIEAAGVPTAVISLIREHSSALRPPRALWVSFPLGRPFGVPKDAPFQTRVLKSLLGLFEVEDGPAVHTDFPEDAPPEPSVGQFCSIELPAHDVAIKPADAASAELTFLSDWHAKSMAAPGARSIVGASGLPPQDILKLMSDFLHDGTTVCPAGSAIDEWPELLRLAAVDLRYWWVEAALAEPGTNTSAQGIDDWFWGQTAAAALIMAVQAQAAIHPDEKIKRVALAALVPAAQQYKIKKAA
ncbi:MAG: hypothetical protein AB8C46_05325 [Burkholderiaceae bacterium]